MQFPEEMKCVNGFKVVGLTSVCVMLKRFAYPCRYLDIMPTIPHKNIETNENFYRKVAFLMYTEMVNFRR